MNEELEKLGLSDEELFQRVDHSDIESERITAPKYSYWHSVFRVFFKKKINIIILALLERLHILIYVSAKLLQLFFCVFFDIF